MRDGSVPRPPVFQSKRPLVFAHRGGAKLAPENTLVAFDNGLAHGADGLELDVHLSADGVPVVLHDATLDRTTDSRGPVRARTTAELSRVDAGYHFTRDDARAFRGAGIGIPTLASVLERYGATRLIIEIKGPEPALARAVLDEVRSARAERRVCLGSFHHHTMEIVRAGAPEVATAASRKEAQRALHLSWVRWPLTGRRPYVAFQVPERAGRMRVVSRAFVHHARRGGQGVHVWVVDTDHDVARLLDWGVEAVISDRPDIAVPARDAWFAHER